MGCRELAWFTARTLTVVNIAERYIIDCVALLYHFLLLFSFSVNYCIIIIIIHEFHRDASLETKLQGRFSSTLHIT